MEEAYAAPNSSFITTANAERESSESLIGVWIVTVNKVAFTISMVDGGFEGREIGSFDEGIKDGKIDGDGFSERTADVG